MSQEIIKLMLQGIEETFYMVAVATVIGGIIGIPLGITLVTTSKGHILENRFINQILGTIVNIIRSIPFIILMVAMLPVAKILVGTSLGNKAVIVMLIIAAAPYVARMVESSLREIKPGIIEAAQAMGTPNFTIIWKVMLPEAKPSLITGAVISTVTILGYSAMAGTIGGTGLGQIAISYGYQRFKNDIIWVCMILIVLIVQVIQIAGTAIAHRTDKRIRH